MKTIVLPNDDELRAQLEAKYQEYVYRSEHSDLIPVLRQRAVFKEEALRLLLQNGSVDVASFLAMCQERFGERVEEHSVYEALGVINSYCIGNADKLIEGGSGLLPPHEAKNRL